MKRIVFLVSGGGGTIRFVHQALRRMNVDARVVGAIADRDCDALAWASDQGLETQRVRYRRREPDELRAALVSMQPDLVVTNIHKIIDADTLRLVPGRFVNLHYSLLPSFGGMIGMETVAAAREKNVRVIGGTCHVVEEEVDAGSVLSQSAFAVDWNDDDLVEDTVFRASCACLLGGLLDSLGVSEASDRVAQVEIHGHRVIFSPPLPYPAWLLDDDAWDAAPRMLESSIQRT